MTVRCEVSRWQIKLITTDPVTGSPRRVTLIFQIDSVTGNDTSGRVLDTAGTTTENFTGTCHVVQAGNVNRMTFAFPWAWANINMAGVAFVDEEERNIFAGTFTASPRTDRREVEGIVFALPPPDPGDTGIGNGSQT